VQELTSLTEKQTLLTAADVSTHFKGISLAVALQYLFTAEQSGALCRDDTMEGLSFYKNLILG
jgi:hypothetical protein